MFLIFYQVLERHEGALSKSDKSMRAVRAELENSGRLIGIRYPSHLLPEVWGLLEAPQLVDGAAGVSLLTGKQDRPSPVLPKVLAKLFRPRKTLKDFFNAPAASDKAKVVVDTQPRSGHVPMSDSTGLGGKGIKRGGLQGFVGNHSGTVVGVKRGKQDNAGKKGMLGKYIGPFLFRPPTQTSSSADASHKDVVELDDESDDVVELLCHGTVQHQQMSGKMSCDINRPDGLSDLSGASRKMADKSGRVKASFIKRGRHDKGAAPLGVRQDPGVCPVCMQQFRPGTLNHEVNAHIDACLLACTS